MRKPKTIEIQLTELLSLLSLYKATVNSREVGETGLVTYEELVADIDRANRFVLTTDQLEHLLYQAKQAILNQVKIPRPARSASNYNFLMRKLKSYLPELFKETASGEVRMVEFDE